MKASNLGDGRPIGSQTTPDQKYRILQATPLDIHVVANLWGLSNLTVLSPKGVSDNMPVVQHTTLHPKPRILRATPLKIYIIANLWGLCNLTELSPKGAFTWIRMG